MAVELPSFSVVPSAPTPVAPPPATARLAAARSDSARSDSSAQAAAQQPFPSEQHFERYPRLRPHAYHARRPDSAQNVLALVHNGAKREIADLLLVVVPAIERHAARTACARRLGDAPALGERLLRWWSTLLRVLFFVAETDEDVAALAVRPAARFARKSEQAALGGALQRRLRSVLDRFSFGMEPTLRAAERALGDFEAQPDAARLRTLVLKLTAVGTFMLEAMDAALQLVQDAGEVFEVQIASLEQRVASSMSAFGKAHANVFVFIFARWMSDEAEVKKWVTRYGGVRARWFFESWKCAHYEQRESIVEQIAATYGRASE